jgi:carboxyl-terminal processing protease
VLRFLTPRALLPAALLVLVLTAGIWLGGHPSYLPGFVRDSVVGDEETRVVSEALDAISEDYYREVPRRSLADASIAGAVEKLRDRFSAYFTPSEYREFQNLTHSQFSGVGLSVSSDPRGLRVLAVYDKSPAKRAGIAPGDVVVEADGRSLAGRPEQAATGLIKGQPGTDVVLTILRNGKRRTQRLTRATVSIPVVASRPRRVLGDKLAHVVLSTFSSGAHGEVRQAVERRLGPGKAEGILLDLRHNGGGLLEEARLVASVFVPDGPIVSTRGRSQPTRTLLATGDAIPEAIPMVVLVDRATASAAEIVTAALQDHERATIVGTRTFGKGVFQEVKRLSNGGALDITVGQYFTPDGRNLGGAGVRTGGGVTPDVTARDRRATRTRDEALDIALRTLAAKVR